MRRHHDIRRAADASAAQPIGPRSSAIAALTVAVAAALLGGCAAQTLVAGVADDAIQLQDGAVRYELRSAGGERIESVGDASTYVVADSTQTRVSIRGQVFARCVRRNE